MTTYQYTVLFNDESTLTENIESTVTREVTGPCKLGKFEVVEKDTKKYTGWWIPNGNDEIGILEFKKGFREWIMKNNPEGVKSIKWSKID
jgi:hypothetical protein